MLNGNGRHPSAAPRSALTDNTQHRRVHVPEGVDGAALLGSPVGPFEEVVEDFQQEAHGAAAGTAAAFDGCAFLAHVAQVDAGFHAHLGGLGDGAGRVDDAAHVVGDGLHTFGEGADDLHAVGAGVGDQFGGNGVPVHHARPVAHRHGLLVPVGLGGGAH